MIGKRNLELIDPTSQKNQEYRFEECRMKFKWFCKGPARIWQSCRLERLDTWLKVKRYALGFRCLAGKKESVTITSENGFVLILAMMIMVVVSLLGIAATTTSIFEMNIAGNEKISKRQFFQADSAINRFLVSQTHAPPATQIVSVPDCGPSRPAVTKTVVPPYDSGQSLIFFTGGPRLHSIPPVLEFRVCSQNGQSVASITAGINFGLGAAGVPGAGGLEY